MMFEHRSYNSVSDLGFISWLLWLLAVISSLEASPLACIFLRETTAVEGGGRFIHFQHKSVGTEAAVVPPNCQDERLGSWLNVAHETYSAYDCFTMQANVLFLHILWISVLWTLPGTLFPRLLNSKYKNHRDDEPPANLMFHTRLCEENSVL